jgi:hypothetical protein
MLPDGADELVVGGLQIEQHLPHLILVELVAGGLGIQLAVPGLGLLLGAKVGRQAADARQAGDDV